MTKKTKISYYFENLQEFSKSFQPIVELAKNKSPCHTEIVQTVTQDCAYQYLTAEYLNVKPNLKEKKAIRSNSLMQNPHCYVSATACSLVYLNFTLFFKSSVTNTYSSYSSRNHYKVEDYISITKNMSKQKKVSSGQ